MPLYTQRTFIVAATSSHDNIVPWVPIDMFADNFAVSFGIALVSGGPINTRVVHTFDDIFDPKLASPFPIEWTHIDATAVSTIGDGNYAFPIRAMRFVITSCASAGTIRYTVMQVGS